MSTRGEQLTEAWRQANALNENLLRALNLQVRRLEQQRLEGREIGWHECHLAYQAKLVELGLPEVLMPNPYTVVDA